MGYGRLPAFCYQIRPFYDNPSIEVPYLLYSVPLTNPVGPTTIFVDRFWDRREHWVPPDAGTVPWKVHPWFGPVPPSTVRPVLGSEDVWENGFSYEQFLEGAYNQPTFIACIPMTRAMIRQRQRLEQGPLIDASWDQHQQLDTTGYQAELQQTQHIGIDGTRADLDQIQQIHVNPPTSAITQRQGIPWLIFPVPIFAHQYMVIDGAPGLLAQVQSIQVYGVVATLRQIQVVSANEEAGAIEQVQKIYLAAPAKVTQIQSINNAGSSAKLQQVQQISANTEEGILTQVQMIPVSGVITGPTVAVGIENTQTVGKLSSYSQSISGTVATGQNLYLIVWRPTGTAISTPSGWTPSLTITGAGGLITTYYYLNCGVQTSVSIANPGTVGGSYSWNIIGWRNPGFTYVHDVSGDVTGTTSSAFSWPTATTALPGDCVIQTLCFNVGLSGGSFTTTMTVFYGPLLGTHQTTFVGWLGPAGGIAFTGTVPFSASSAYAAVQECFKT